MSLAIGADMIKGIMNKEDKIILLVISMLKIVVNCE
jgi:hypothetical protein